MKTISDWLGRLAQGWLIGVAFGVMVFCMAVLLPRAETQIKAAGASGPIDLLFFPSPENSFGIAAALGPEGRAAYRLTELTVDVLYPLAYSLFYSLLISVLLRRVVAAGHPFRQLNLLPLGALFFDFLENAGIVTLLTVFPAQPLGLGLFLQVANGVKWLFAGASVAALLFALLGAAWQKIRR